MGSIPQLAQNHVSRWRVSIRDDVMFTSQPCQCWQRGSMDSRSQGELAWKDKCWCNPQDEYWFIIKSSTFFSKLNSNIHSVYAYLSLITSISKSSQILLYFNPPPSWSHSWKFFLLPLTRKQTCTYHLSPSSIALPASPNVKWNFYLSHIICAWALDQQFWNT